MKNKNLKIALVLGAMCFVNNNFLAQVSAVNPIEKQEASSKTYEIVNAANISDLSTYQAAMDNADFDSYRYINSRRKLIFESGVVIELLSVYELNKKNIPVDESKAKIYVPDSESSPIYSLSSNGHILARYNNKNNK